MKNKNLILIFKVFTIIFISGFIPISVSALADSDEEIYTFRFENCTVADALREISSKSGINIISNNIITKEILSKSYTGKRLVKIISDLLRGENCAVVWNFNNGNLDSIGLYTYDEESSKGQQAVSRRISSPASNARSYSPGTRSSSRSAATRLNRSYSGSDNIKTDHNNTGIRTNNRSNNNLPNFRSSDNNNRSTRVSTQRNRGSGTSRYTTNKRKTIDNEKGSRLDEQEEVETVEDGASSAAPPEPAPEKYNGLEPPPMPPGM